MSTNNADSHGEVNNTEGQKPDKKLVFDSKDIGKREKTDYFVRVEGAEERKREVIRRMQQQKDELVREKKAKEAAEKKDQKLQRRQERKQKFADAVWAGRRKVVTISLIIIILILAIAGPFFWKGVVEPLILGHADDIEKAEINEKTSAAISKQEEALKKVEEGNGAPEVYEEAKKILEDEINNAQDNLSVIEATIAYADFVYDIEGDPEKSVNIILAKEEFLDGTPDSVHSDYYVSVRTYYTLMEDEEKVAYYNEKISEYLTEHDITVPEEEIRKIFIGGE